MNDSPEAEKLELGKWQRRALLVAVLGIFLSLVGAALDLEQFFHAYLFSFLYWWRISVGCLGLALIYQMTGGGWGYAGRPFFDAGIRTLPLVTVAFIPLAVGVDYIYEWTDPGFFAGVPHAENRQLYLSVPFFIGRAVGYFAISLLLGFVLTVGVVQPGGQMSRRMRPRLGGIGAVIMVLVVSFAGMDWGMSLDPDWYSTIYSGLYVIGGLLTAMCVVAAGVSLAYRKIEREDETSRVVLHDLGKLLLAFLMVWAYFDFSQFLIIYSGNLPEEVVWYQQRFEGRWQWLALAIVALHFALPFLLLLSRDLKRDPRMLGGIAVGLAVVHTLQVFWAVMPSLRETGSAIRWLDLAVWVGLGGLWVFEFLRQLKHRLLPVLENWPHLEVRGG